MCSIEGISAVVASDFEGQLPLTSLHGIPKIVIDDTELWNLHDLPKLLWIWLGDALPGPRVLNVGTHKDYCLEFRPSIGSQSKSPRQSGLIRLSPAAFRYRSPQG